MREFGSPGAEEFLALDHLLGQVFDISPLIWERFRARVGDTNFRILKEDGQVRAALAIYAIGHFFGGRSVPTAGIAVVGVAPEHRGSGVGVALMGETLRALHAEGVAFSSLYPATRKPYRRVGYEVAGSRVDWVLPLGSIGVHDRTLPAVAVDPLEHGRFHAMYRQWAATEAGLVDRSRAIWERITQPYDTKAYACVLGDDEGYLIYHQPEKKPMYDVAVRDFVALTPGALRRAWSFLADHHSIGVDATWVGPANDPRLAALPEIGGTARWSEQWMARLVHLPAAMAARGYLADGELDLEVTDPLIPENAGRWRLLVRDGTGRLERGGAGSFKVGIAGLAPIFTGFYSPIRALRLGLVEADAAALRTATVLFGGPEPWMADRF